MTITEKHDLTRGGIFRSLLYFSLPYMLANIIQALYGGVDTLIVGRFGDAAALSAVGTGSTIMATINMTITGMSMGVTVLIGQYMGSRQYDDVKESIGSTLSIFAIISAALAVILFFLAEPLANMMRAPAEAYSDTLAYMRICFLGLVFTSGYNAISAILRGLGDTKTPLIFIGTAGVCHIILDFITVGALKMGAAGAALSTVTSQGISLFIAVIYLRRKDFIFDFKLSSFKPVKDKVIRLLKLGVPIGLQEGLAMLSFVFIFAIINDMGLIPSATASVGDKVVGFAMMPPGAFSAAIAAFTAQNVGAKDLDRARKGLYAGIVMGFSVSAVLSLFMAVFSSPVMSLFSKDAGVIAMAPYYLIPYAVETVLVCFVFSLNGFFNGCGRTGTTMTIHLLSTFLVRVPVAWFFARMADTTLAHVTAAAPISSAVQVLILFICYRMGSWKNTKGVT